MKEFVVQNQIEINSSRHRVWNALTDPDRTEKYFYGCRVYSNWQAGDTITFKRRILWIFPFQLSGRIRMINPETILKYSLKNSKSSTESVVTISLKDNNGRTIVRVTDDVGQGRGAEDRYYRSVKGWKKILRGLRRITESEPYT